jgi:phage baseplate assembly protein W
MANGKTYGITFPFRDSFDGKYLDLTDYTPEEIRSDLIHLLLTRKGSRYFLPDFGTRLYEYIFEPLDGPTFNDIESEIRDSVETYIPNLQITNIIVDSLENLGETDATNLNTDPNLDNRIYRIPGLGTKEYTAKVRVEYTITSDVFNSKDFVIINI